MNDKSGWIKLKGGGYIPLHVKNGVYIAYLKVKAVGKKASGDFKKCVRISAVEGFQRQAFQRL